jgi:hypothetical protein
LPHDARFPPAPQQPNPIEKRCSNQKYICVCFLLDLELFSLFFAKSAVGKNIVPWYTTVSLIKKQAIY